MKPFALLLLFALCLAFNPAFAASNWTLYKGTSIVQPRVDYPTLDACNAAVPSPGTFTCRAIVPVPLPTPPPEMHAGLHVDPASFIARAKGFDHPTLRLTNEVSPPDTMGDFRTVCDLSHESFDDSIVYPGQPGKAHAHAFFGNTLSDAGSTDASILNTGNSTCRGGTVNRSSYWVPAMVDTAHGNKVVHASVLIVYYKTGSRGVKPALVQPFPPGLKMIAGDPTASAPQNPSDPKSGFSCDGNGHFDSIQSAGASPACAPGHSLWATVLFPQCWDGKNLDSPDHKSHMSYSVPGKGCPADHPVPLPELALQVLYAVPPEGMAAWRLASDVYSETLPGGYSMHADYRNGWNQAVLETWVKNCDNKSLNCDAHRLGDGRRMDWCPNPADGVTGCAVPPLELTTSNGWTLLGREGTWVYLDIARSLRFGPNADGTYATAMGAPGPVSCTAPTFGSPKAGTAPRTCAIAAPNPLAP